MPATKTLTPQREKIHGATSQTYLPEYFYTDESH